MPRMSMEEYRKITGVRAQAVGERMSVEQYHKEVGGSMRDLPPRRGKYNAARTEYDGIIYDSRKEAEYARSLEGRKHAHELKDRVVRIERQVPYNIVAGPYRRIIATYFADFRVTYADLHQEVVDVKPFDKKTGKFLKTPVYTLKKKLVEEIHQIKIIEV